MLSHPRLSLEVWGDHSHDNKLLPSLYDAYCVTWMDATSLWLATSETMTRRQLDLGRWPMRTSRAVRYGKGRHQGCSALRLVH